TDLYRTGEASLEDATYARTVRDIGESVAAHVLFQVKPKAETNFELLERIKAATEGYSQKFVTRFFDDEMALLHAAQVYIHCTSEALES
ncbi:hypothetical protein KC963_00320, partial [Candidatus Saccharibacteria bacterium]|nr:hypothetical protein [Candidatus Saccharibacteria bacterium]